MTTRNRFVATYYYPGTFFHETTTREIDMPTRKAAEDAKPEGRVGYTDRLFAIRIHEHTERLYTAENGDAEWINEGTEEVDSWVYGEKIHVDDIPDTPEYGILRSNVRNNSKDGYAVKHAGGGWTIAEDYNRVVPIKNW